MGRTRSSHTESHFGSHQEYRRAAKPDIMKYLVVLSVVAACAYAQVGHSGIISPDGKNTQFSHDFAAGIAVVGPSGLFPPPATASSQPARRLCTTAGRRGLPSTSLAHQAPSPLTVSWFSSRPVELKSS